MPTAKDLGKSIMASTRINSSALRKVLDVAIVGGSNLPGARQSAATHLGKKMDREGAIDSLVTQHVSLAGAQGFATNVGGLVVAVFAVPANLAGITVIQCRMVAAIAHLRGYDIDNSRVRSAILMCLLGEESATDLVRERILPSTPMAIATAPAYDPRLDDQISSNVLSHLAAQIGGKKLPLLLGKRIPLIGGGVGALTDGYQTFQIATYARREFVDRRRLTR